MSLAPFRIVIVGGGPVGLTAAHMLTRAGIDFVLLERGSDICPDHGASLAIWTATIRIFDQLGLYNAVCEKSCPVKSTALVTHSGQQYDWQSYLDEKHHGHISRITHRADLLRVLYENLPEKSKRCIFTNKKVIDIKIMSNRGASVCCEDGSEFEATMVIGSDGVHSTVRSIARALALKESSDAAVNPEKPFTSSFSLVFGSMPRPAELSPGDIYESHGRNTSTQLMNGKDRSWFFLYQRLEAETQERVSYQTKDLENHIKELSGIYVTPKLTVHDIHARATAINMVNLEEGMVEHQYWKRILLMGDSYRKMTPNIGFGYHGAVWDLAVLVNRLREHLMAHPNENISDAALMEVFSQCKTDRDTHNKTLMKMSADVTRSSTWQTWPAYILDRFVFPWTYSMSWMSALVIAPLLKFHGFIYQNLDLRKIPANMSVGRL